MRTAREAVRRRLVGQQASCTTPRHDGLFTLPSPEQCLRALNPFVLPS
ncbi:hypothetical protein ACFXJ8_18585 [Nonomuraea sp. NPDC059194]